VAEWKSNLLRGPRGSPPARTIFLNVLKIFEIGTENNIKEQRRSSRAQKNGEIGLGQKAGFASVQRFAEKEPVLGTRLFKERREVALKRVKRGAWEDLGWEKRTIAPRGLQLTANGCNGPLQANLRRRAGTLKIVDEESVKSEAPVLLIRATIRLSRCAC
jgi:hypothetical protein